MRTIVLIAIAAVAMLSTPVSSAADQKSNDPNLYLDGSHDKTFLEGWAEADGRQCSVCKDNMATGFLEACTNAAANKGEGNSKCGAKLTQLVGQAKDRSKGAPAKGAN